MTIVQGVTIYFCTLEPVDNHSADNVQTRTLRIARCHVDNRLRQIALFKAFGVSLPTVRRAVHLVSARGRRGRTVVTPALAASATWPRLWSLVYHLERELPRRRHSAA